jgi:antitoxin component YwqK of YwqJK toxin-antitoxin module
MKYKKVPNNESAIEINGKVVLSFDPRYKEYLKWRDNSPELEKKLVEELEQEIENKRLYNNGAPHKTDNLYRWYRKNGILSLSCEMKNGKRHGVEKGFYDTGEIRTVIHYKNGIRDGKLKSYHANFTEEKFRNNRIETWKNGKLHGEYIDYHLNNKERAKGDMLYGMMNGKWTFWYHNGKKELECEFDFGNPVGSAKIYNDNGILKEDVSF